MSKNKKIKKPKPKAVPILRASEIRDYISLKYEMDSESFWKWFFGECRFGDTNLLLIGPDDISHGCGRTKKETKASRDYFNIIREDFLPDADEDFCLEIERDIPVLIDCSEGAIFLIFVSDKNEEQMQIAVMDRKGSED